MAKNRDKQRENRRRFTKEDRVELRLTDKIKDPTPYLAMKNLTRGRGQDAQYFI